MTEKNSDDPTEFLFAEYSTLRDLRQSMATVGESRFNIYLGILTGSFAIIGILFDSLSDNPLAFFIVIVVMSGVFLIGIVTFIRIVDRTISMASHNRGMNRIRHYFVEKYPEIAKFLILPIYDDTPSFESMSLKAEGAGAVGLSQIIAILNSLVAGVSIPILTNLIFNWDLKLGIAIGVVVSVVVYSIHSRYHGRRVSKAELRAKVYFPSPSGELIEKKSTESKLDV